MKKKLLQAISDEHDLMMENNNELDSDYTLIDGDADSLLVMVVGELKAIRYELAELNKKMSKDKKE